MCRDVSVSSVYKNPGAVQFDLDILKPEKRDSNPQPWKLNPFGLLEEVGFRFPLQGSV